MSSGSGDIEKVVAVVDLARYTDIIRRREEQTGARAVAVFNQEIQGLIRSALGEAGVDADRIPYKHTGDGAVVILDEAEQASRFAEALHRRAQSRNVGKTDPLAQLHFRVGLWSGPVELIPLRDAEGRPGGHEFAGLTVAYASRLQLACTTGEILIGRDTWADLPRTSRLLYGPEELMRGKRSERLPVHRRTVVKPAPWDLPKRRIPLTLGIGIAATAVAAILIFGWMTRREPGGPSGSGSQVGGSAIAHDDQPPAPTPRPRDDHAARSTELAEAGRPAPPAELLGGGATPTVPPAPPSVRGETQGPYSPVVGGNLSINQRDPETEATLKELNRRQREEQDAAYRRAVRESEDGLDFFTTGDLDQNEEVLRNALEVLELRGRREGMAKSHLVLGAIALKRGQIDRAREEWTQARTIYQEADNSLMVKRMEERLGDLPSR
jgi:class 3 adenylate cyclase